MKFFIVILMFFVLSGLLIISNNDLGFYDDGNLAVFSEMYVSWLNQIYLNIFNITGEVVGLEWFPNSSE